MDPTRLPLSPVCHSTNVEAEKTCSRSGGSSGLFSGLNHNSFSDCAPECQKPCGSWSRHLEERKLSSVPQPIPFCQHADVRRPPFLPALLPGRSECLPRLRSPPKGRRRTTDTRFRSPSALWPNIRSRTSRHRRSPGTMTFCIVQSFIFRTSLRPCWLSFWFATSASHLFTVSTNRPATCSFF